VDKHPSAKKVAKPSERLVCLNTNTHKIAMKNYVFLDFVESEDTEFMKFKNTYIQMMYNGTVREQPSEYAGGLLYGTKIGTRSGTKEVQTIEVGDVLDNGDVVKGVCAHLIRGTTYVEVANGVLTSPGTWVFKDGKIQRADSFGHEFNSEFARFPMYQLITESSMYPVVGKDTRLMVLDELQTADPFYHSMKDSIITSGRFRNKLIVV